MIRFRFRPIWVSVHRWVGLAMAIFLVIEGATGAMLAFRGPLTRFFDRGLFAAAPASGAPGLDAASLIEAAERIEPRGVYRWLLPLEDGVALVHMDGRTDPSTGRREDIGFGYLALDPWSGREIRRMDSGLYSAGLLPKLMPFVYDLHKSLALGEAGQWILGVTALLWTIDCFAGAYLTLPSTRKRFLAKWKTSWAIRWQARWPRINLDVHRAGSLWLWLMLLLFAWSSVELTDKLDVYGRTMEAAFGPSSIEWTGPRRQGSGPPALGWHGAQARGRTLAEEAGSTGSFAVGELTGLWYDPESREYVVRFDTSRRFPADRSVLVFLDGDTGGLYAFRDGRSGNLNNRVSGWLAGLHMITDPFEYTAYRVVVVMFGLALVAISATGVIAWWVKRGARRTAQSRKMGPA